MYVTDWNLDPMMSDVFVFCFDFDVTTFGIGLFQWLLEKNYAFFFKRFYFMDVNFYGYK